MLFVFIFKLKRTHVAQLLKTGSSECICIYVCIPQMTSQAECVYNNNLMRMLSYQQNNQHSTIVFHSIVVLFFYSLSSVHLARV